MLASLLLFGLQAEPVAAPDLSALHARRAAAGAALRETLTASTALSDAEALDALLRAAVAAAVSDPGSAAAAQLAAASALAPALAPTAAARDYLRRALVELSESLTFAPVAEAPVPVGYPSFTPIGEVLLLQYPVVRLARVPMSRSGNGAFWSLFLHIQGAGIAMTAPVQTNYSGDAGEPRPATMGFLYDLPDRGPAGSFGTVEVFDQPEVTVLSLGQRGWAEAEAVEAMDRLLRDRVTADYPGWEAVGAVRVQEYNSPSVRGGRRFFEVQLPVRRAAVTTE
jgi:hypothetical protein